MTIPQITDHVERGLGRVLEQYKNSPAYLGLIESYIRGVQRWENAIFEVIEKRNLSVGFGIILDYLGKIVDRKRGGLSDADYLIALKAKILILRSRGRIDETINILQLSVPEGYTYYVQEADVTVLWFFRERILFTVSVVLEILARTKPAGVRTLMFFLPLDPDDHWLWGSRGFGTVTDASVGGKLTACLEGVHGD
jgi:hypothetical protein